MLYLKYSILDNQTWTRLQAVSDTLGHGTCGGVCGELGAVPELHGDLLTGLLQLHNVPCCLPLALPPITCTHTAITQQLPWRQGQRTTVTAGTSKDVNANTSRHLLLLPVSHTVQQHLQAQEKQTYSLDSNSATSCKMCLSVTTTREQPCQARATVSMSKRCSKHIFLCKQAKRGHLQQLQM